MIRSVVQTSLRLWCVPSPEGIRFQPVLDELDLKLHEPAKVAWEPDVPLRAWRSVQWATPEELVERYPTARVQPGAQERFVTSSGDVQWATPEELVERYSSGDGS